VKPKLSSSFGNHNVRTEWR